MVSIYLTTNLKLGKPTSDEKYNVQVQNANMDILDSSIIHKVDKIAGMGLSSNDYTTEEKNKLSGIEPGAQRNTINGIKGEAESSYRTGEVNITKANIGLNNVPNVATNDQTPTFSEAITRTNIVSGEKLSVILGKIKKWFSDLKAVAFSGSYNDLKDKPDIPSVPTSLKNPNTLTFTGAVTGSYDGSENKTVAIPTGTNNLMATMPGTWLDATQGKILNDKIASQNINFANKLNKKANLTGVNDFRDTQRVTKNIDLIPSKYAEVQFVSQAEYNINNRSRASYGFHNAGVNAGTLYLDIDGHLKFLNNSGTIYTIQMTQSGAMALY